MTFLADMGQTFLAILPLALIALAGAFLRKASFLKDNATRGLSDGVVYLFLPCLIFDKITNGFSPEDMPFWWIIPLTAMGIFAVGALMGFLLFFRRVRQTPDLIPLSFIQNAGYLVVALGEVLVPDDQAVFSALIFLYVLGHSPLLWSIGKLLITTRNPGTPFRRRDLLTPPLFANLGSVSLVLLGLTASIPTPVRQAVGFLGDAAVPVSLVVLGASLGTIQIRKNQNWDIVVRAVALKLLVIPCLVISLLFIFEVPEAYPFLAFMLALQSMSPHATNLIVQVRTYGGDVERTGAVLLASYGACIITIPLWVSLWSWGWNLPTG